LVGGTSLSSLHSATADATLSEVVALAMAGDPTQFWQLVAGGLTSLPERGNGAATLVETVWNQYFLNGTAIGQGADATGFIHNNTGSGGWIPANLCPPTRAPSALRP